MPDSASDAVMENDTGPKLPGSRKLDDKLPESAMEDEVITDERLTADSDDLRNGGGSWKVASRRKDSLGSPTEL